MRTQHPHPPSLAGTEIRILHHTDGKLISNTRNKMIKGNQVPMSKTIISGANTDIFIIKKHQTFHFVLRMEPQDSRLIELGGGASETWPKSQLYVCRRKPGLKKSPLKPFMKKNYCTLRDNQRERLFFYGLIHGSWNWRSTYTPHFSSVRFHSSLWLVTALLVS